MVQKVLKVRHFDDKMSNSCVRVFLHYRELTVSNGLKQPYQIIIIIFQPLLLLNSNDFLLFTCIARNLLLTNPVLYLQYRKYSKITSGKYFQIQRFCSLRNNDTKLVEPYPLMVI